MKYGKSHKFKVFWLFNPSSAETFTVFRLLEGRMLHKKIALPANPHWGAGL